MKKRNYIVIGASMLLLLVVLSATNAMIVPDKKLESLMVMFYEGEIKSMKASEVLSLILAGTRSTLQIIFATTAITFLIGMPLGVSAYSKNGMRNILIQVLLRFTSAMPVIVLVILLINLPFIIFSDFRYYWMILIIALIGIGRISHLSQEKSHLAAQTDLAIHGRNKGYRGIHFIGRCILPSVIPALIVNFFFELGRVTLLLGQLAIISIFFTQTYLHEGMGFGRLEMTGYNWTTMLGETKEAVKSSPWIPIMTASAFLYSIIMFQLIAVGTRQLFITRKRYL